MMSAPPKTLCGVVVSSGKMMGAIKVRTAKQVYNKFLRKHFQTHQSYLVSDRTSSTRTGDVVRIAEAGKVSKHIRHRVTEILAPWGPPINQRPAVLSEEEVIAMKVARRKRKEERKQEKKINLTKGNTAEASREIRDNVISTRQPANGRETEDDHVEGVVEGTQVAS